MALAEVRDLNRHRTGFRLAHLTPVGFYLPKETREVLVEKGWDAKFEEFKSLLKNATLLAIKEDMEKPMEEQNLGIEAYTYFLGTQVLFEHNQGADKFIYEAELRTGLGAHFRYAEHLNDAARLYLNQEPQKSAANLLLEENSRVEIISIGRAEPE